VSQVARFTVSLEPELLERFDQWVEGRALQSRSQGVRDMMRAQLSRDGWEETGEEIAATLTFVYDHHKRDLLERVTHLQHSHLAEVVSSLHVHIDHLHCMEVLALRGPGRAIHHLATHLLALPGILSGCVSPGVRVSLLDDRHRHHPGDPETRHDHRTG